MMKLYRSVERQFFVESDKNSSLPVAMGKLVDPTVDDVASLPVASPLVAMAVSFNREDDSLDDLLVCEQNGNAHDIAFTNSLRELFSVALIKQEACNNQIDAEKAARKTVRSALITWSCTFSSVDVLHAQIVSTITATKGRCLGCPDSSLSVTRRRPFKYPYAINFCKQSNDLLVIFAGIDLPQAKRNGSKYLSASSSSSRPFPFGAGTFCRSAIAAFVASHASRSSLCFRDVMRRMALTVLTTKNSIIFQNRA